MVNIVSNKSIDNIQIDSAKEQFRNIYTIDYQNDKIVSISIKVDSDFIIDNQKINIMEIETWYKNENPYFDGTNYIFQDKNIVIYEYSKNKYEITLYSNTVKSLYERNIDKIIKYNDITNKKYLPDIIILKPFVGLDIYMKLGNHREEILNIMGKPTVTGIRKNTGAIIDDYNDFILRYDNNVLTQIHLMKIKNRQLRYNEYDLFLKKEMEKLIKNYNVIERWAYYVIPDLGISFDKSTIDEIFIYDEYIKKYWMESKRPITSW